jgi:hypothetical protein
MNKCARIIFKLFRGFYVGFLFYYGPLIYILMNVLREEIVAIFRVIESVSELKLKL